MRDANQEVDRGDDERGHQGIGYEKVGLLDVDHGERHEGTGQQADATTVPPDPYRHDQSDSGGIGQSGKHPSGDPQVPQVPVGQRTRGDLHRLQQIERK